MIMLSVDPGTRSCGMAVWEDGKLIYAGVVVREGDELAGPRECAQVARLVWREFMYKPWQPLQSPREAEAPHVLAFEIPQVYQRAAGKSKGDPSKLLPVYGVVSAITALFSEEAEVRYGTPRDWKGGVGKPKSVKEMYAIEPRVMERLSAEERATIVWPKNKQRRWDVVDAIGVGLHHIGRFERHRTLARE